MRHPFIPFLIAACLVVVAGWSGPALAKPKKLNGCAMSQLQSPEGRACEAKMEDDIMHNRSYYHVLVCSASSEYCCKFPNAGGDGDCVRVSKFSTTGRQPNGTLSTVPGTTGPGNLGIAPPRRR